MSYSVKNVRNLYYAGAKVDTPAGMWDTLPTPTTKGVTKDEGTYCVYKDLEGCKYFECVENKHIVRTPKIERVTYVKVTPGSAMNSKEFSYEITVDDSKLVVGKTYTLNIIIPNFNGIDVGLEQSVRGTATAKPATEEVTTGGVTTPGKTTAQQLAEDIVNDIKDRVKAGTNDVNYDTPFLWAQYIDIDALEAGNGVIIVKTKIPEEESWKPGEDYMPELQERILKFEFAPVYDEDTGVYEYYWASLKDEYTKVADVIGSYKKKLDAMWWFYNIDRGEIVKDREWMDPRPMMKPMDFAKSNDEFSVLDVHYRVDGDGSIMGDVDITIICKEASANSTENAAKIVAALKEGRLDNATNPEDHTFGI